MGGIGSREKRLPSTFGEASPLTTVTMDDRKFSTQYESDLELDIDSLSNFQTKMREVIF